MGATHCRSALTDLAGRAHRRSAATDIDIAQPPDVVMPWIEERFLELHARHGRAPTRRCSPSGSVCPAPVEYALGTPVSPPLMPGWDGYPIADRLRETFAVPIAGGQRRQHHGLGRAREHWRDTPHMVFIKVGHGIGARRRRRRPDPTRRRWRRRRHRAPPHRRRRRHPLPVRQRRLPRGDRQRRSDGPPARARQASRRPTDSRDVVALARAGRSPCLDADPAERAADRRSARQRRQPAQPTSHRDRRGHGPRRPAPAGRHPRGHLPALAAPRHAPPADRPQPARRPRRRRRRRHDGDRARAGARDASTRRSSPAGRSTAPRDAP